MTPSIVALIPARKGSKRLQNKNIYPVMGHPLMAYAIASALDSGIFSGVYVSTDSEAYAEVAKHYGAEVILCRLPNAHKDTTPDINWVRHALENVTSDCFSILRITNPFRQPDTIKRAWRVFLANQPVDSLRAVEPAHQHPGKMWVVRKNRLLPLLPFDLKGNPWHSSQYQALPRVYEQNASLEIAWSRVVQEGTIAGESVVPFFTQGFEGFDIHVQEDIEEALMLVRRGLVELPKLPLSEIASEYTP